MVRTCPCRPVELVSTLRTRFGHASFRPGQAEAVGSVLAGRHALVVMPTGAGKSLIYQLASLHLPGLTLVISPLIALMKDQVDGLTRRGIAATAINSTVAATEQARRLRMVAEGRFRLAYVAPERLRSRAFWEALRQTTVSLLAVDEAHCISQWGHDFRPDYLHLAPVRKLLGAPVTVALTATATPTVQEDIVRLLELGPVERIVTGFNRPNLSFSVCYAVDEAAKLRALRDQLLDLAGGAGIVYTGTRREAEEVAEFVHAVAGAEVAHYHAGLDAATRSRVQEAFLGGRLPVVVATNAFGMGIDRADVRLVLHYSLPGTLEAYYQEAGRAGRDGAPAQAVLIYAPKDRALQEWFIENDAPSAGEVRLLYRALRAPGRDRLWQTMEELSLATALPEIKVRVGLAQLEAAGSVRRLGDAGLRMLLGVDAWNEAAIRGAATLVEERRRSRRAQLAAMVEYAEADGCRRRLLLAHFGDRGAAEAALCCDNCLAGPPAATGPPRGEVAGLSEAERVALAILDCLRRLRWAPGRRKLAQLLKGSRAKAMRRFAYDRSPYYGRLANLALPEIDDLIGQLVHGGQLKVVGGELPVLRLTPAGAAALAARTALPLRLPRPLRPEVVERKRAEREAGGTVALTRNLLAQGLAPAEVAARRGLREDTIYNHASRLIAAGELTLAAVVTEEVAARVRWAAAQAGENTYLSALRALLPEEIGYGIIRCVLAAERGVGQEGEPAADGGVDEVSAFLARPHPRPLSGPWEAGWALGFHSGYAGAEWSRSPVGDLTFRLKYRGDREALPPLVAQALDLIAVHPELAEVDALVPVPPTTPRPFSPVHGLAEALGERLVKPVCVALTKTRRTAPQKEMRTLAQKRANVAGAFAAGEEVRGLALLVLDDLYDSGATLTEVCQVLRAAGAQRLYVLTLTRTIHSE